MANTCRLLHTDSREVQAFFEANDSFRFFLSTIENLPSQTFALVQDDSCGPFDCIHVVVSSEGIKTSRYTLIPTPATPESHEQLKGALRTL